MLDLIVNMVFFLHRLRALSDLEGQLQARHAELQNIRELQEKQGGGENLQQELETQWRETHRGFSQRYICSAYAPK